MSFAMEIEKPLAKKETFFFQIANYVKFLWKAG